MRIVEQIVMVFLSLKGTLNCDIDICLTWDVTETELELRCKISSMRFAVSFENPWHQEQGHCLQPQPESVCYNNYKNVTVIQNLAQKITVLKVHGHIDNNVNGKWVCKHGSASEEAAVNVTVLKQVVYRSNSNDDKKSCWEIYVCWSLLGYISTLVVFHFVVALIKMHNCCQGVQSIEKRLYTMCKWCLSRSSCSQNKYCVLFCQRSVHVVIISTVVGIPLFVGLFDYGICFDYHGFTLLGVLLGIVGAVLLEIKCGVESKKDNRKNENQTLENGSGESFSFIETTIDSV